tara:strand:- start:8057 stop:8272 length:216 start_codon:yes stop_codon:yes gene_type:complete
MTIETAPWYKTQTEYLTGALFGLITLDVFMLLIYSITEKSISGYGLGGLAITIPIALIWYFQHLYAKQNEH